MGDYKDAVGIWCKWVSVHVELSESNAESWNALKNITRFNVAALAVESGEKMGRFSEEPGSNVLV